MIRVKKEKKCLYCHKEFYKKPTESKIHWEKRKYCSKQCAQLARGMVIESVTSLCYYCKKARPSLCSWIAEGEPVFERAETKIMNMGSENRKRLVEATMVQECSHFKQVDVG
jgi:hypothetical protein